MKNISIVIFGLRYNSVNEARNHFKFSYMTVGGMILILWAFIFLALDKITIYQFILFVFCGLDLKIYLKEKRNEQSTE